MRKKIGFFSIPGKETKASLLWLEAERKDKRSDRSPQSKALKLSQLWFWKHSSFLVCFLLLTNINVLPSFYLTGPLGAISNLAAAGPQATTHPSTALSEANSAATSRTGSKENLCEECIQNPLDLIDASIQVHFQPFISVLYAQFFSSLYISQFAVWHTNKF